LNQFAILFRIKSTAFLEEKKLFKKLWKKIDAGILLLNTIFIHLILRNYETFI